jgi:hypothetical protein
VDEEDLEFFLIIPIIIVVGIALLIPSLTTMSPISSFALVTTGSALGFTMFYTFAPANEH